MYYIGLDIHKKTISYCMSRRERNAVDRYCEGNPHLEPKQVLADPAWETVRAKAQVFIQAFNGTWPKNTV
jgi:hypothetical protein